MTSETKPDKPQPSAEKAILHMKDPLKNLEQIDRERVQAAQDAVANGTATDDDNLIIRALSQRLGDLFDF